MNYFLISDALTYYRQNLYTQIDEAPWFVSRESMKITSPPGVRYCSGFLGDLVASGEQSFLEMWKKGQLKEGMNYVCATPCFRDEKVVDNLHRNYFFKVELVCFNPEDPSLTMNAMIKDALNFFNQHLGDCVVFKTEIGFDIEYRGLELGSYGIRKHEDFHWVYGTGCAEPRLSQALKVKRCGIRP